MWTGSALVQPGWALFKGTAGDHARHQHHAVQIAISPAGLVSAWIEGVGDVTAPALAIGADCAHQLGSGPDPLVLIYLERESGPGRTMDELCVTGARRFSNDIRQQLMELLRRTSTINAATIASAVTIVGAASAPATGFTDERISKSIDDLPRPLPQKLTLAEVARGSGLSPSRYAHLFQAHTGMPLRPYLRWVRLKEALTHVAQGANLTEAAYAAGFSDSAHLSRIFRRTFGIAPKTLLDPSLSVHAPE